MTFSSAHTHLTLLLATLWFELLHQWYSLNSKKIHLDLMKCIQSIVIVRICYLDLI